MGKKVIVNVPVSLKGNNFFEDLISRIKILDISREVFYHGWVIMKHIKELELLLLHNYYIFASQFSMICYSSNNVQIWVPDEKTRFLAFKFVWIKWLWLVITIHNRTLSESFSSIDIHPDRWPVRWKMPEIFIANFSKN